MRRRSYTPEQHIAEWTARFVRGDCSLEDLEWVVAWTLREVDEGRWRA